MILRARRKWFAVAVLAVAAWGGPARAATNDTAGGEHEPVRVVSDASGMRLQVGGRDFLVKGVNWDYIPIGQNYAFNLWQQPEDDIVAALDHEMSLVAGMGANAIRVYAGIPPRWVKYIHDRFGIFCIINHTVARYGFSLDGVWHPSVDYSNSGMRTAIAADVARSLAPYRGVPGVLMYLLGNENNYGLSWSSFEIEALPRGERDVARARHLYSLFGQIIRDTKAADPEVAIAIANGDAQYIDVIAKECKGLDVFGSNVYRGISARDMFAVVRTKLGVPLMFTEFGSDAFNARSMQEDQAMQARYLIGQWREICEQSAGRGREGNAIGGCVFQWSDGWWKFGQDKRLDVQDANASWPNGGYTEDFVEGEHNMNEEWWGICAKGRPDGRWLFELYPRAAYYALRRAFAFDPYAAGAGGDELARHFGGITPASAVLEARGDRASLQSEASQRMRVSGARLSFETVSTDGSLVTTPEQGRPQAVLPAFRGFDQMQSFFVDFEAHPANNVTGFLSVNALGSVPRNPIDQIFYEARVNTPGRDRFKIYQSRLSWDDRLFQLDAFYRTGHYHWGYEGDYFGLYREANYGPNIDIYDSDAPVGFELAAKRALSGLKVAFGPQLWWGANPAVMLKYRRQVSRFDAAIVQQYDLARQGSFITSSTVPQPTTRKTALSVKTSEGPFQVEAGGIWAGANRAGDTFQVAENVGGTVRIMRDRVLKSDAFGGKVKLIAQRGPLQWYIQAASMGLVAEAGPTGTTTLTGWNLKDTGSGNQRNLLTGFTLNRGNLQIAPNFLWQKPIIGPMPDDAPSPGRLRDIFTDPFVVRANREMNAAEILVTYDPSPASWFYAWDNDLREESPLAGSVGFIYRQLRTGQDAMIGFLANGMPIAFPQSTPPRDLWELNARLVSRLTDRVRVVAHGYAGTGEPNAGDPRRVERFGGDVRLASGSTVVTAYAKFNDWGPYDYHRDFNLTFPVQLMGDLSRTLGTALWLDSPQTRIGVRGTWRSLDRYSPRYTGISGDPNGNEWELRTYVRLAM